MSEEQDIQSPGTLPMEVSDYLWSEEVFDAYEALLQANGIDPLLGIKLSNIVNDLVEKEIAQEVFVEKIQGLGIDPQLSKKIAVEVITNVLVNVRKHLPFDLDALATLWGVGEFPEGIEVEVAEPEKETPQEYIHNFVVQVPDITDARIAHRLESILLDYLVGKTERGSAKEHLMRPAKINGLDLSEEAAEALLGALDVDRVEKGFEIEVPAVPEVAVVEETEPEPKIEKQPKQTSEVSAPDVPAVKETPKRDEVLEDHKEIEQIKEDKPHIVKMSAPVTVEAITESICENEAFKFDDQLLQDRCKKIVESRVREVRDARTIRGAIEKSVEKGGLGVTGRRLADIMEALESAVAAYEATQEGKMAVRKQEHVEGRIAAREAGGDQAARQEQILTKRYADLTGKVPTEHVEPLSPGVSRTSVSVSAHQEMLQSEGKIDTERVKAALENAKKPAVQPHGTPSMKEISFEKRLSGPVDELRTLNLIDFRRLSSDPKQAATKLKDKVDLIEDQQGHAEKVEAIDAWRSSPLYQLYVSVTRDAVLAGMPITQILAQQREKGEDTLSDEELAAVMQVNAELRF
ncbi:MAG: hypothetical protein HQ488_04335 [Parcubacteria group bacterium]|nr:hypothetical protein [Parcubacteria group bacterium]